MPEELMMGKEEALRQLNAFCAEDGKLARVSMRKSLRAAAKILQSIMLSFIPAESGITRDNVKVRSAPRSRRAVGILVGVFGGARNGKDIFYAGFTNYGHKTPGHHGGIGLKAGEFLGKLIGSNKSKGGGEVKGVEWTDKVIAAKQMAIDEASTILIEEIEALQWKE